MLFIPLRHGWHTSGDQLGPMLERQSPGYGGRRGPSEAHRGASTSPHAWKPSPPVVWGASPRPAERAVFWPKISSQIPWLPGRCFQPTIQTRCFQLSGPFPPGQRLRVPQGRSDSTQGRWIGTRTRGPWWWGGQEREPAWACGLTPVRMGPPSPADLPASGGWGG